MTPNEKCIKLEYKSKSASFTRHSNTHAILTVKTGDETLDTCIVPKSQASVNISESNQLRFDPTQSDKVQSRVF